MLSVAVTNFNRSVLLFEAIEEILFDGRVDEIIISDDDSTESTKRALNDMYADNEKVKLHFHNKNVGMHLNKYWAVSYCKNDWVILFDSDNVLTPKYLDAIPGTLYPTTIYMPDFALPNFDYRPWRGRWDAASTAKQLQQSSGTTFGALLNTCNYVVHRDTYLNTWKLNEDIDGADTVWFLYNWLNAGYAFEVVEGMEYFHRVHEGSGFMKNLSKNANDAQRIEKLIKKLA